MTPHPPSTAAQPSRRRSAAHRPVCAPDVEPARRPRAAAASSAARPLHRRAAAAREVLARRGAAGSVLGRRPRVAHARRTARRWHIWRPTSRRRTRHSSVRAISRGRCDSRRPLPALLTAEDPALRAVRRPARDATPSACRAPRSEPVDRLGRSLPPRARASAGCRSPSCAGAGAAGTQHPCRRAGERARGDRRRSRATSRCARSRCGRLSRAPHAVRSRRPCSGASSPACRRARSCSTGALREAGARDGRAQELSMSEIAIRCGRVKRDRSGNESGETSWLAAASRAAAGGRPEHAHAVDPQRRARR